MKPQFYCSKYTDVITPESAEHGERDEELSHSDFEDRIMTLREIAKEVEGYRLSNINTFGASWYEDGGYTDPYTANYETSSVHVRYHSKRERRVGRETPAHRALRRLTEVLTRRADMRRRRSR